MKSKKTKLNPEHVFLQFLMMFLTLVAILIFSVFVRDFIWFDSATTLLPIISGTISIILSPIAFLIFRLRKEKGDKTFLFFTIFLLLLGFLTIFAAITETLSFSTQVSISSALLLLLSALFLFFLIRRNWLYSDLDFWIIYSLSLFIFSRIFFLEILLKGTQGYWEYSSLLTLFGYIALGIGMVNEYWELKSLKKKKKTTKKKVVKKAKKQKKKKKK